MHRASFFKSFQTNSKIHFFSNHFNHISKIVIFPVEKQIWESVVAGPESSKMKISKNLEIEKSTKCCHGHTPTQFSNAWFHIKYWKCLTFHDFKEACSCRLLVQNFNFAIWACKAATPSNEIWRKSWTMAQATGSSRFGIISSKPVCAIHRVHHPLPDFRFCGLPTMASTLNTWSISP